MGSIISDWMDKRRARKGVTVGQARIEPVTGFATSDQALESPYVAARREWNERYGSYVSRARTWQIVALASMGLSAVLVFNIVDLAKSSKVKPFIVEVDKLGQVVAVKPADEAGSVDQRIVRFQLANWISNVRSVSPDRVVQKRWLDSAYAISSPSAAAFLNEHYKKHDPFELGKTNLVSVEVNVALPLSPNSWQIQWTETSRGLNGLVDSVTRWQAILNLTTFPPTTEEQIIKNPTGIVIDQPSWQQQM